MTDWTVKDLAKGIPILQERWPCLPGQRHTFAPLQLTCLCGSLSKGIPVKDPEVCVFFPTGEKK